MHATFASCALALVLGSCATSPPPTTPKSSEAPTAESPEPAVKVLKYEVSIAAPVQKVWDTMFSPDSYTEWTSPFMPGSYFEGSWDQGERIHFLAPGGSGMVAEIEASRRHELVSIKHVGFVVGGVEDTTSDAVRSWAPAYENYYFESVPEGTIVRVEHEVPTSFGPFMDQIWPKALEKVKSLAEAD